MLKYKPYIIGVAIGMVLTFWFMHAKVQQLQIGMAGLTAVIVMQNTPEVK